MPFGARRFTQLVYQQGAYYARFVPLSLGDPEELVDMQTLCREIEDNARRTPFPLREDEERLALKAFIAQARNKAFSRAAVESVAARGQQRVIVDVLDAGERAAVERMRKVVFGHSESRIKVDLIATWNDDFRTVLAILDKYLPKPKGT